MECALRVGVLGMNFKTADLDLREAMARASVKLTGEQGLFFPHATVILSTCNRCEIYFSHLDLAQAHSDLLDFLRLSVREAKVEELLLQKLYSYFGMDCFYHLCKVTCGLDSAIVAETEIQHQVKCSYLSASKKQLPSPLHFLFQKALRVGKKVRSDLPLIQGGSAVFIVLWEWMERFGFSCKESNVLFVGNSQMNRELASFLKKRGLERADLSTRYLDEEFSQIHEVRRFGYEHLQHWGQYDLIVCASQSAHFLIQGKPAEIKRRLLVDFSVPRNIDPKVGTYPKQMLFNIEELDALAKQKMAHRQELLFRCEKKIRQHTSRICTSYRKKQRFYQLVQSQ